MAWAREVGRIRAETVDVGGRSLACRRAGEGPPLLLFHGAWSDSRQWRLQLDGLAGYAEADLRPMLAQVTVPTLLLYGALDERAPIAVAQDLHRRTPGSGLRGVPGAGHLSNIEAAAEFNDEVRRLLPSVAP